MKLPPGLGGTTAAGAGADGPACGEACKSPLSSAACDGEDDMLPLPAAMTGPRAVGGTVIPPCPAATPFDTLLASVTVRVTGTPLSL